MVAATLVSIIVAVVSLVGAVSAAAVTAYIAYWSDKCKRHTEAVAILNKYRDPLLLAAVTLQHKIEQLFLPAAGGKDRGDKKSSRLRKPEEILSRGEGYRSGNAAGLRADSNVGIYSQKSSRAYGYKSSGHREREEIPYRSEYQRTGATGFRLSDGNVSSYFATYTAFLVGQFFAWVYILRLESQFLNIHRTDETNSLADAFFDIEKAWSDQDEARPTLELWRGQQSAIGEIMTFTASDGQHACMGYNAFCYNLYTSEWFGQWFEVFASLDRISLRSGEDTEVNKGLERRMKAVNKGLEKLIEALDPGPNKVLSANYNKLEKGIR